MIIVRQAEPLAPVRDAVPVWFGKVDTPGGDIVASPQVHRLNKEVEVVAALQDVAHGFLESIIERSAAIRLQVCGHIGLGKSQQGIDFIVRLWSLFGHMLW